ncbi:MAG: PD-(D/E)XK nuclease family protein [Bacteroidetes bacterium]|nr:PD-(D/E)XK nuclease family protein [Bacteroidota bacterium]HET6244000.1 PD-(D/E)XK nuclease family protein [Bacteroidia bacterium]
MEPFLAQTARYLFEKHGSDISEICIVLPNRRAGLFLKTHLAALHDKPFWAPEIFSVEDFLSQITGITICDNISLTFRFYAIYKELEGENAQAFDEFVKWAQVLLHDFNEIDGYLADTEKLFSYIDETRAMEVWNPDGSSPTDFQKNYLKFWKSLGIYYQKLKQDLTSRNQAYQGLVFRIASEDIVKHLEKHEETRKYKKIIFVGFNALNQAEEKIIRALLEIGKAEILWDSDSYYLNDKNQEAGKFLRKFIGKEVIKNNTALFAKESSNNKILWIENLIENQKKEINIIGVPQKTGQAKTAGHILSKLHTTDNYKDTALVLADEQLLLPVLNSLPQQVSQVNVTMGYPLRNTPFSGLIEAIFQLQENSLRMNSSINNLTFYHKDILKFLNHPYLNYIKNISLKHKELFEKIISEIKTKNSVFLKPSEINTISSHFGETYDSIKPFFISWNNNPGAALENILDLINILAVEIEKFNNSNEKSIEAEYLYYYARIVRQLKTLLKDYDGISDLKTLKAIFIQLVSAQTLPFYGEPLKGLQLMGMLETRTLDFDTIILLSANEGILPSGKSQNSFIPYEIKKLFKIPTHTEKDAIFAYHFYRLIQRAKNIFVLYNTETDEFGSGEKSRFVTQLIYELPKINANVSIREQVLSIPVANEIPVTTSIIKTDDIIEKIEKLCETGFSPSAINTFTNCPLDFYYKYIVGLREETEVEETIEAASIGTFIHDALFELFKPFIEKKISSKDIESMKDKVGNAVTKAFSAKYALNEMNQGKNLLTLNVAKNLILNFLNKEKENIKNLEAKNIPMIIKSLEEKTEAHIIVKVGQTDKTIKFKGVTDRVDQIGNISRVIDYKTGFVDEKELKMDDLSEISNREKSKSLQLLLYSLLFLSKNPDSSVNSGIISFKKLSAGVMNFSLAGETTINKELIENFESELSKIINFLFDKEIAFEHHPDSLYCPFCAC